MNNNYPPTHARHRDGQTVQYNGAIYRRQAGSEKHMSRDAHQAIADIHHAAHAAHAPTDADMKTLSDALKKARNELEAANTAKLFVPSDPANNERLDKAEHAAKEAEAALLTAIRWREGLGLKTELSRDETVLQLSREVENLELCRPLHQDGDRAMQNWRDLLAHKKQQLATARDEHPLMKYVRQPKDS